jgi:hypothetical protein
MRDRRGAAGCFLRCLSMRCTLSAEDSGPRHDFERRDELKSG